MTAELTETHLYQWWCQPCQRSGALTTNRDEAETGLLQHDIHEHPHTEEEDA